MVTLVKRDSKGKIRVAMLDYEWDDNQHGFVISRWTGQYNGKMTEQPPIIIQRGKVNRTVKQQCELEFAHKCKEYSDKGYKYLEDDIDNYTEDDLNIIIGTVTTGSAGVVKPMLAKQEDKVVKRDIFEKKEWYGSRKIDGLRCLIYMDDSGELKTSSRGAMNYDAAMYEILSNKTLIKIFEENPGLIMDGEAYHHGYTLQQLNSVARTQKTGVDYEVLQFYWYDIVQLERPFSDRLQTMSTIANKYNIKFEPERNFEDNELRIQFVPQIKVSGWDNMMKLHNDYVAEGWEGLVVRDASRPYKPNGRTNDMIKIKQYKDDEFEVIGYELGLRGNEDMCFKCITSEGKEFLAKPWGDRALKDEYVNNFDKYLGKMAVVKYFYMSDDNVPLQPSVKCIRLEEDM